MTPPLLMPREFLSDAAAMGSRYSLEASRSYTRWLANVHYENFHVVTLLLPKDLHQDFFNVYAFCRWADDLGDELGDPATSLHWLGWWRGRLNEMERGEAQHPVFVALRDTMRRRQIPVQPFHDLITAFERDQTTSDYADYPDLYEYCRHSANPVGRIVLHLCGYHDDERMRLSDETCTGLQLANFWQDVTVDLEKNRIYLPLAAMARHGYSADRLRRREFTPEFRESMREAVGIARGFFQRGLRLVETLDRRLAFDIDLFSQGGLYILKKIEEQGYNVLRARPKIGKWERAGLLLAGFARHMARWAA